MATCQDCGKEGITGKDRCRPCNGKLVSWNALNDSLDADKSLLERAHDTACRKDGRLVCTNTRHTSGSTLARVLGVSRQRAFQRVAEARAREIARAQR